MSTGSSNDDAGSSNGDVGLSHGDAGTSNGDAGFSHDDAGSSNGDAGDGDENLAGQRYGRQIEIILSRLDGVAAYPGERLEQTEYLYRAGRILVRDVDLERVQRVVGTEIADPMINGVTALTLIDTDVQTALSSIDEALGTGVAAPDHVFWVAPARACPATEPEVVSDSQPVPALRTDHRGDGRGVLVSVVDTGFVSALSNSEHPWLHGVLGDEESFDPTNIGPYVGHGTFVAGVLRCIAPATNIYVDGFLTHGGAIYESEIVKQLNDAMDRMPDIISMSAGCTTRHHLPPLAFQAFWEHRLRHCKGTVLVAAAGNDGSRQAFWPAAFEWSLSVGALDRSGHRADYSNFGSWVDLYAVGSDLVNAYPNGTYRYAEPPKLGQTATFVNEMATWSGTSFATPVVAGMIAARMSHTGQSGRRAADSILRIARGHARPGIGAVADPAMALDFDAWGP